jgi:hypothetical protein
VEVTLSAANGTAALTNCSSQQLTLLSQQRCSIPVGDFNAASVCQLALPCMGEFVLKGCVNGSCSTPISMGRNVSWWAASPWSSPPQLNLLPDRQNVTVGGALNLAVQNPWWGPTSGLLVWGNAVKREVRVLSQVRAYACACICIFALQPYCKGTGGYRLSVASVLFLLSCCTMMWVWRWAQLR